MSKRKLKEVAYSIHKLIKKSYIPSYKTRADTESVLIKAANDLHGLGFKLAHIQGLKNKHITALIGYWKTTNLSPATIKNYISKLRWVCRALKKPNIIAGTNDAYNIQKRSYIPKESKAIDNIDLTKITDKYLQLSLKAQQLFGLRREESLKFIVSKADKGDHIKLQGSWTKGGVSRNIPIITAEQREFLNHLHQVIGENSSLTPKELSNKQQINRYIVSVRNAGLKNLHGLRHAYAQNRYKKITDELTNGAGWECPFKGGKPRVQLKEFEKKIDYQARLIISQELGHARVAITKTYLG